MLYIYKVQMFITVNYRPKFLLIRNNCYFLALIFFQLLELPVNRTNFQLRIRSDNVLIKIQIQC